MRAGWWAMIAVGLLAGCGQGGDADQASTEVAVMDVQEEAAPAARAAGAPGQAPAPETEAIAPALPRIAYVYRYNFRLPGAELARVQDAHLAICDRLGPARCRVLDMKREAGEAEYASGSLKLQVAAADARRVGAALGEPVVKAGGTLADSGIAAEDLSKQMIDTGARIRAKEQVILRLTEILRTRTGTVEQLVAAEKAISEAQEELDAARAWLAEMRVRVATSTVEIGYQSGSPAGGGFWNPVRDAFGSAAGMLGMSLAALVLAVVTLGPWALLIAAIVLALRSRRLRRWWRRVRGGDVS